MAQEIILPKVMEASKGGIVVLGRNFNEIESTFAVLIIASIAAIGPLLIVHRRNKRGASDL